MTDFVPKILAGIIYLFIIGLIAWVGILAIQEEGGFMFLIGVICLSIPFSGLLGLISMYYYNSQDKRWEALSKMYRIPERLHNEYGEQWGRNFQLVIGDAIKKSTDSKINKDLQNCSRTIRNISRGPSYRLGDFYYMNAAFRYTGCHLKITDSTGKVISEIV